MTRAEVVTLFEPATSTGCHILIDPSTHHCAIIDAVLDYIPEDARLLTKFVGQITAVVEARKLTVEWILETHAHADHVSAQSVLKEIYKNAKTGIGANIHIVQQTFAPIFLAGKEFRADASQWDKVFADNETFKVGNLHVEVLYTPGHTPACVSYYVVDDAVFCGDTIFMPDMGTARADFPGGSVETLWNSINRLLSLPDHVRIFVGHDYAPGGREHRFQTTVLDEKNENKHVKKGTTKEEFVKFRNERDATLDTPKLLIPSLQLNIRAGRLPPAAENGITYLMFPVNKIGRNPPGMPSGVQWHDPHY